MTFRKKEKRKKKGDSCEQQTGRLFCRSACANNSTRLCPNYSTEIHLILFLLTIVSNEWLSHDSALRTCVDCAKEKRALPSLCYIHTFKTKKTKGLLQRMFVFLRPLSVAKNKKNFKVKKTKKVSVWGKRASSLWLSHPPRPVLYMTYI